MTIALATMPRAARLPSDLAQLDSADPMTLTLLARGGQERVDAAHARAIKHLIAAALRGE